MHKTAAIIVILALSALVTTSVWAGCIQWACTTQNGIQNCYCVLSDGK